MNSKRLKKSSAREQKSRQDQSNPDASPTNYSPIWKLTGWRQSADQLTEITRRDKSGALIPHDEDQGDDPIVFVRSFTASKPNSNSSNHGINPRNLKTRKKSSMQRVDDQHASHHGTIILDHTRTFTQSSTLFDKRRRRPRRDDTHIDTMSKLNLKFHFPYSGRTPPLYRWENVLNLVGLGLNTKLTYYGFSPNTSGTQA